MSAIWSWGDEGRWIVLPEYEKPTKEVDGVQALD